MRAESRPGITPNKPVFRPRMPRAGWVRMVECSIN
ncbi:hypothetical protein CBM2585_A160227 [Cupriavidus taiwanensis]|nr:hypothetical protein CBM2585_A160227 [Cupriavidus taiwanensis]